MQNPKTQNKHKEILSDAISLLLRIAWIVFMILLSFLLVLGVTVNRGESMTPAFHDRDTIIYYRLSKEYHTGDVIVYTGSDGNSVLGRIIAKAGDVVDITGEGIIINGYPHEESYASGEFVLFEGGVVFPIILSSEEYFILCDNRSEGDDSRLSGAVSSHEICGKVMLSIRQRDF